MKKTTTISLALFFAILSLGLSNKATAQAKEVVQVANLGELREQVADNTTVYEITGEVFLTHQHPLRNQKYIQDATGAVTVDDNPGVITTIYEVYDGITGMKGKLSVYNGLLQFLPFEDPGDATSNGNIVEPLLITLSELSTAHQAMLIRINAVDFVGSYTNFAGSQSYDIQDPTGTGVLRTPNAGALLDYFGTPVPSETTDMITIVSQFNDAMQVFPRSLADFYPDGLPTHSVTFAITDEDNAPITDAVITFDGVAFAAGEYFFAEVEAGSYAYTVEKAGYYTRSGQLAVTGDDVVKTVVLVAEAANAVNTFPWTEGFEDAVPPASWKHYALGAGGWVTSTTANTGTGAAYHNFSTEAANSWLVTPQIMIDADNDMLLSFFERNQFIDDYGYSAVMISTGSGNPEHGEFVEVYESAASLNNYTEKAMGLASYAGEVIYIAFVYEGQNAHRWFIDDVTVEAAPEAIPVANLAELRQKTPGDLIYEVTGEVFLTHQHGQRNQKYFQDATAAILVDDPNPAIITTPYNLYDGVTGLKGRLSVYAELLQFIPVEDPGAATSVNNVVEPLKLTLSQITPAHQAMLIIIEAVEFDTEETTFAGSTNYPIFDASGTSILRTPNASSGLDYLGTAIPTEVVNMIALVSQFNDDMQIFPRSLADIGVEMNVSDVTNDKPVTIYPNPFSGNIHIAGAQNFRQIVIFNGLGQIVETIDNPSENTSLNTSSYKQGIYFVRFVDTKGAVHVEKMIKR